VLFRSIDHILNSIYNYMKNNDKNNNNAELGREHHNLTNILNCVQLHLQQSDSLLEWLYGNNNDDSLVDLLIGTFEIMNNNNSQSDDPGHKFLLPPKFAELILLQIIDVIYSQRLPEVWFLISNNRCLKYAPLKKGTWDKITCLIRLMNQKIPILESACSVLVKHFKTQQWKKNILTGDYFVSSVTSEDCRHFFKTGELQTEGQIPRQKRLGGLKKNIPRRDIDVLWVILATFAYQPPFPPRSSIRWHLLDLCFFGSSTSVFNSGNNQISLLGGGTKTNASPSPPPSIQEVICCCNEHQYLRDLLNTGAIVPLLQNNSFLLKLLKASINLHVNSLSGDGISQHRYYISTNAKDEDARSACMLWKFTDLLVYYDSGKDNGYTVSPSATLLKECSRLLQNIIEPSGNEQHESNSNDRRVSNDDFRPVEYGCVLSVVSGSQIVRSTCYLLALWADKFSEDEHSRYVSFFKSVEELVQKLVDEATLLEKSCRKETDFTASSAEKEASLDDMFARVFRDETNDSFQAGSICLREAASFLYLTAYISTMDKLKKYDETILQIELLSNLTIQCTEVRVKLWNIVASNFWVQNMQEEIFLGKSRICSQYTGPLPILDLCCKVMSGFALRLFQDQFSSGVIHSEDSSLAYVASCIITCIEGAGDLLESQTAKEERSILSLDCQEDSGAFSYSPDAYQCVKVIARGCSLLSLILSLARHNILENSASAHINLTFPVLQNVAVTSGSAAAKNVISLLLRSAKISLDGDVCFRSALMLMRSVAALTHCIDRRNSSHSGDTVLSGCDSSVFGALNEYTGEAFLNFNRDNLPSTSVVEKQLRQFSALRGLFPFLKSLLRLTKPSLRFSVAPHDAVSLRSRSGGRALCDRQSGKICSLLAALAVIWQSKIDDNSLPKLGRDFFLFDETDRIKCSYDDLVHFKHLQYCLCSEVCRLSHISETFGSFFCDSFYDFLTIFLNAMVDASVLEKFPTGCLKLMEELGGKKSRKKELSRLRYPDHIFTSDKNDEPNGSDLKNDATYDAPGPLYLHCNLWSFGKNLGDAISRFSKKSSSIFPFDKELTEVGKVLSESNDEPKSKTSEFCCDINQTSLEAECIKRLIKVTRIFAFLSTNTESRTLECLSAVVMSLLEQLNSLAEGYLYRANENPKNPYLIAKAHVIQQNYIDLTVAAVSTLLSCLRPQDLRKNFNAVVFFRDRILIPSIQGGSIDLYRLMQHASEGLSTPHVPFSMCGQHKVEFRLETEELSPLSRGLIIACRSRIRELVIHTAAGGFDGKCQIFNNIKELATNPDFPVVMIGSAQEIAFRFGESLKSFNLHSGRVQCTASTTFIGNFADRYLSSIMVSGDWKVALHQQMIFLRCQTIRKHLVPKLLIRSNERRKLVLSVLVELFNNDEHGVAESHGERKAMVIGNEDINFVSLVGEIFSLIRAIVVCIKESLSDSQIEWSVVELLFRLSSNLLSHDSQLEPVDYQRQRRSDQHNLLKWSHNTFACRDQNDPIWKQAVYIFRFAKWIHTIATLLLDTDSCEMIHKFAFNINSPSWGADGEIDISCVPINSMRNTCLELETIEQHIFPASTTNSSATSVMNAYAKIATTDTTRNLAESFPISPSASVAASNLLAITKEYCSESSIN